jgi:hypothetical protein
MRYILILFFLIINVSFSQTKSFVSGVIFSATTKKSLEKVNIVNLNDIKGSSTNHEGYFEINAKINDTLHLSYIGYKSINIRVTKDWLEVVGSTKIELTESAYALEEVVVNTINLTGYLEVDLKQVPVTSNDRYAISGFENYGYEGNKNNKNKAVKNVNKIFNPADLLYNTFGKKPKEIKKLQKIKKEDNIRNNLVNRFDREMLLILLDVNMYELEEIINQCEYSQDFIKKANDLQLLDAISECYEEYKVLKRSNTKN